MAKSIKTRNNNSMTDAAFWSFIRSALRQKSRWWKPIQQVKQEARRAYKGDNKRQKFEYQCSICDEWFPDKEVEVDHIIPAGSLTCGSDLEGFVDRLFCEKDGLRVVCKCCHRKETNKMEKKKKSK